MDKINKLSKLVFLLQKHEKSLQLKAIACKIKLDEEIKKHDLLKNCLDEYRAKLTSGSVTIQAVKYQQYQQFFQQLQNAILQQNDVVQRCKAVHQKWLKDIEMAKKKLENMNNLINKEKKVLEQALDKKEMQQATDLYNLLKNNTSPNQH